MDRWPGFVEALARKSSVEPLLRALTEAVDACDQCHFRFGLSAA
ncbi:hypothetical protein WCD96_00475 [Proteus mirabilis]|nr:hypothetical protein [Proteus mirabilis]